MTETARKTPLTDNPETGYRSHYAEHEHNKELCRTLERDLSELAEALAKALDGWEASPSWAGMPGDKFERIAELRALLTRLGFE